METNIDDAPAEWIGLEFQNKLLEKGAIDFYYTSIQMKKGRPGWKLSVLVEPSFLTNICDYILENTSSIGLRYYSVDRQILTRRQLELETKYGKILLKEVITPSGKKRYKIENDTLQKINKLYNISLPQLHAELYPLLKKL